MVVAVRVAVVATTNNNAAAGVAVPGAAPKGDRGRASPAAVDVAARRLEALARLGARRNRNSRRRREPGALERHLRNPRHREHGAHSSVGHPLSNLVANRWQHLSTNSSNNNNNRPLVAQRTVHRIPPPKPTALNVPSPGLSRQAETAAMATAMETETALRDEAVSEAVEPSPNTS